MTNVVWGFPNPQSIVVESEKKKYVARFDQSGTSNPVATVLEDSTGFANTWARVSTGKYEMTFGSGIAVPRDKVFMPGWTDFMGQRALYLPIAQGTQIDGRLTIYFTTDLNGNAIGVTVECTDDQWAATEWSTLFNGTGYYLEFYIYP